MGRPPRGTASAGVYFRVAPDRANTGAAEYGSRDRRTAAGERLAEVRVEGLRSDGQTVPGGGVVRSVR